MLFPRLLLRTPMMTRLRYPFFVSLFLLLATNLAAQSKAPIPTLTTDDVIGARPTAPGTSSPVNDAAKPPAEKTAPTGTTATPTTATADETKKKAEKDWNNRLKQAQERHQELERRADQTELQITQLRNQLFSATARAPETNSQLNTQISEFTALRNRLRAEAQAAQQDVAKLEAEGQANAYQVARVSLTNEKGEPNSTAYQAEQDRLRNEIQDAQARLTVLQIRLNNVQAEVLNRSNGDNFTLNRLRQEREQVTTELKETRTRIEDLKSKLQAHQQKAAAAGVPLGS